MDVDVVLTRKDWFEYQAFVQKQIRKRVQIRLGGFWPNVVFFIVLTVILMVMLNSAPVFHWPTAAFVAVVLIFFGVTAARDLQRMQQAMAPSEEGVFVGKHHFRLDAAGIHSRGEGYQGFHEWSVVKSIVREGPLVMIFMDTVFAFLFPIDQLDHPDAFVDQLHAWRNARPSEDASSEGL